MSTKEATKPKTDKPNANGAAASTDQFPSTIVRTLQGVTIEAPTKFKPGHVLSYEEALFASTAWVAAARSAFEDQAKAMRSEDRTDADGKKLKPATDDEVRTAWAGYYEDYVWSPRGEATPVDPIEAEMRRIARSEITIGLKKKNLAWPAEKDRKEFMLNAYTQKHEARLRKQASDNLNKVPDLDDSFLAAIQGAPSAAV